MKDLLFFLFILVSLSLAQEMPPAKLGQHLRAHYDDNTAFSAARSGAPKEEAAFWERELGKKNSYNKKSKSKGSKRSKGSKSKSNGRKRQLETVRTQAESAAFWDHYLDKSKGSKASTGRRQLRNQEENSSFMHAAARNPDEEAEFWDRELDRRSSHSKKSKPKGSKSKTKKKSKSKTKKS